MIIDNELLAAYAEDNVSQEEREAVRQYLAQHPDKMESVMFAMDVFDDNGTILREDRNEIYMKSLETMLDETEGDARKSTFLPMAAKAAKNTVNNLCAITCEGVALRNFGFDVTDGQLLEESEREGWLNHDGTALHNIGRLAGLRGLSVSHRYNCSANDIQEELAAGNVVIAAVDENELTGNYINEQRKDAVLGQTPNHVVIVEKINDSKITVIDSATPARQDVYPLSQFIDAWNDSSNYLIVISNNDDYMPHPINLDDVEVEDELIELREAIAENAHEVWAESRRKEGWTYGPKRDDAKKQHPDMLPYNRLPESEKEYDRIMAMNTIKLVKKLGWELSKDDPRFKMRRATSRLSGSDFSKAERIATMTLIMHMITEDYDISPKEIHSRDDIYKSFGITAEYEEQLISLEQASQIYKKMEDGKQRMVKRILHDLSYADGVLHVNEQQFLKKIGNI